MRRLGSVLLVTPMLPRIVGVQVMSGPVVRVGEALAASVAALLLAAPGAFGHAAFLGSDPAPGARLPSSPSQVTLTFTEPLNRRLASARLERVGGGRVAASASATSDRRLVVRPASELGRGAYRIRWHSVSTQDGHALEGSFSFGVRTAAAGGGHTIEQSPLARSGWARIVARVLLYVALLLFAGALLLRVILPRRDGSWLTDCPPDIVTAVDADAVRRRERTVTTDLGVFAAAAAALAALLEAVDAAAGFSARGVSDYLLGNVAGAGRLAVVVFVVLALTLWQRHGRLAALLATCALGAVAVSGHAGSASPRTPSVLNDWVHLLAGAMWLGGIALIVIVWAPAVRGAGSGELRQWIRRDLLPRFGRVALPAFAAVISTGVVSMLVQLGTLSELWGTVYGRVLTVKVVLVAVIALLSVRHARRATSRIGDHGPSEEATGRQWRMLRAQPLLGVAVLSAVGLLATFPLPPRQLQAADAAAVLAPCDPCPLPRPGPGELAVADSAGRYLVAGWLRRDRGRLSGTVRVLDYQGRPANIAVRVLDARQAVCAPGCRRFRSTGDADIVTVALTDGGRGYTVRLPATWRADSARSARTLLGRVQQRMRALRSLRQVETITSGPGTFARTRFRLRAPDRLAYDTDLGLRNVVIAEQRWFRAPDIGWTRDTYGSGIAFSTRTWFRWTSYAQEVRVLRSWRRGGRNLTELALMDPGTPVWIRLTVDEDRLLALQEKQMSAGRFMSTVYSSFDRPVRIAPPRVTK